MVETLTPKYHPNKLLNVRAHLQLKYKSGILVATQIENR